MCLDTDSIDKLHDASTRLRELHAAREEWRKVFAVKLDGREATASMHAPLSLSKDEGDRIFHARITAVESELEELGWRRTIRVESEKRQTAEEVA
jgi:hypothetical protein